MVERLRDVRATLDDAAVLAVSELEHRLPSAALRFALLAWAIASATLLALFVLVNRRLNVARRHWPRQLVHGTSVRVAPSTGPAVIGVFHAEIIVPPSLLDRSDEEQRLILAHEREHVRAGDHLLLGAAWLAVATLPWHPAVWYLVNRIRLAVELDCDARVLRAGASPTRYGRLLIDMAAWRGTSRIGALALTDGISHLERRILAMRTTRSRHAAARGVVLAALGGLLVVVACEAKVPTSAEITQMDVAAAERGASEAGLLRTPGNGKTDFFVNGAKVSAEVARGLEAKNIGSIEVVKSELASGRDTIFVTTADRMPKTLPAVDPVERARFGGGEFSFERKAMTDSSEHTVAHVERELAGVRWRTESNVSPAPARQPLLRKSRRSGGDEAPIITIDGKIASEAELAALDERDIASLAIYKGKEALLKMISDKKEHLEVTSGLEARPGVEKADALIAVTTKMARQSPSTRP